MHLKHVLHKTQFMFGCADKRANVLSYDVTWKNVQFYVWLWQDSVRVSLIYIKTAVAWLLFSLLLNQNLNTTQIFMQRKKKFMNYFQLAMYIGDPQSVAAITPSWRNLAKPKSAEDKTQDFRMSEWTWFLYLYSVLVCYYLPIFSRISCGCGQDLPPLWLSKIFCGFKSRWTMPLAYNAFIAPAAREFKLLLTVFQVTAAFFFVKTFKTNKLLTQLTEEKSNCVLTQSSHHCNKWK